MALKYRKTTKENEMVEIPRFVTQWLRNWLDGRTSCDENNGGRAD
jgi:hypothetical protein